MTDMKGEEMARGSASPPGVTPDIMKISTGPDTAPIMDFNFNRPMTPAGQMSSASRRQGGVDLDRPLPPSRFSFTLAGSPPVADEVGEMSRARASPGMPTREWLQGSHDPNIMMTPAQIPLPPSVGHSRDGSAAPQLVRGPPPSQQRTGPSRSGAPSRLASPFHFTPYVPPQPFDYPAEWASVDLEASQPPPPTTPRPRFIEPAEQTAGYPPVPSLPTQAPMSSRWPSRAASRNDIRRGVPRGQPLPSVTETYENPDPYNPGAYGRALTPRTIPMTPRQVPMAEYQAMPPYTGRAPEDPETLRRLLGGLRNYPVEGLPPGPQPQPNPVPANVVPQADTEHGELRSVLDAIRTNPERWSLPRDEVLRAPEQLRYRPSVIERRARQPLDIDPRGGQIPPVPPKQPWVENPATASTETKWEVAGARSGWRKSGSVAAADGPAGTTREYDEAEVDKNVVTWDGPDDPANPSNWPMRKKYTTSLILSLFSFIAPFSAQMTGPATDIIGAELNMTASQRALIGGLGILAAEIGPYFFAPVIEYYGRAPVIRYGHVWHLVWNTACGFATTGPQLLAFRFVGGLAASATQILPPGLTADVYPARMGARGDSVHNYLPFFGSAIGPIFGAFVTRESNWRWVFWGTSIFSIFPIIIAFVFLDESLHSRLLERKAARLRQETGNQALRTPFQKPGQTFKEWMMKKIALPFVMLVAHPIVQVPFLYRAYLYGTMYLV